MGEREVAKRAQIMMDRIILAAVAVAPMKVFLVALVEVDLAKEVVMEFKFLELV